MVPHNYDRVSQKCMWGVMHPSIQKKHNWMVEKPENETMMEH